MHALRGAFDRAGQTGEDSTERDNSQILGALVRFPAPYTFKIVAKPPADGGDDDTIDWGREFASEYVETLSSLGILIEESAVEVESHGRNGKFVRVKLPAPMVGHAALVSDAFECMEKDARILWKH